MDVQQKLMTVEEFWEQYAGKPYELIDGEVVETVPTGFEHGVVVNRVSRALDPFVDAHHLGVVVAGEVGTRLGAHTLRGMDVAFIGNAKLTQISDPKKYVPFAPDLVVEVVSPGNTGADLQLKVSQYLKADALIVWMVYPDRKQVVVYDSEGYVKTLTEDDILDGGEILPGFNVPVRELFPPAQEG